MKRKNRSKWKAEDNNVKTKKQWKERRKRRKKRKIIEERSTNGEVREKGDKRVRYCRKIKK